MNKNIESRKSWMDILRILACYMVIMVHAPEDHSVFNAVYNQITRIAVPLFLMMSGTLILPMRGDTESFLKKKFMRIALPFLVWSLFYYFSNWFYSEQGFTFEFIKKLPSILYMLPGHHLWYLYSIMGIYLCVPIISPWIRNVHQKEIKNYLLFWGVSLLFLYISYFCTDIKMNEWNVIYIWYYFSGYIGYFILGYYLNKYAVSYSTRSIVFYSIIFISISISILIFMMVAMHSDYFLISRYLTLNVACLAVAVFLVLQRILQIYEIRNIKVKRWLMDIANMSFGIYLIHLFILNHVTPFFVNMDILHSSLKIPVFSLVTFAISYFIVKLISYSRISKYIIG